MYFRILKKDLKRKRTMNAILLVFIILASTFIASSVNNMTAVMTALDRYFDKAEVPDYAFCLTSKAETDKLVRMLEEHSYEFRCQELLQANPAEIKMKGEPFDYANSLCLCRLQPGKMIRIFDANDRELTEIRDGEIYVTAEITNRPDNYLQIGDTVEITVGHKTKRFTVAGSTKDAVFGSSMAGITRFLISENDYLELSAEEAASFYDFVGVYTDDGAFMDRFNESGVNVTMNMDRSANKSMYLMDMVAAAVMIIVSVCLILISMVILRFTIHFTMSEEFREIGVMKAIGIGNAKIRGLYIIKYLVISVVGGMIGFVASVPFGNRMLRDVSQKIILDGGDNYYLNLLCVVSVVAVVELFCYFFFWFVKQFAPIEAIRNGEKGQRYRRKSVITLEGSRLAPVIFMAANDILSDIRRFAAMVLIFILGMLLVIIPVNTINTLQSDGLITLFNMAECDHVISGELFYTAEGNSRAQIEQQLRDLRKRLSEENIEADVFQEIMFKMTISFGEKRSSSLAFQGIGDITTDRYEYLDGTAPQGRDEVAVSHLISDAIGARIGDTVQIKHGETEEKYIVTAIYQTMNNLGEGIRFHPDAELDFSYAGGSFGRQITYRDDPDKEERNSRKELLKSICDESKVFTAGEYINEMIGDIAGQFQGLKQFILVIVLCINILVTVLMVKSFIAKEKGEIAVLKAIGFRNTSLVLWQTVRIGIILFVSVIVGVLLGQPVSEVSSGQAFKMMGAYSIQFDIAPFEVYVLYPAVVFGVTVLAAMLAALQVRSIPTAQISNNE